MVYPVLDHADLVAALREMDGQVLVSVCPFNEGVEYTTVQRADICHQLFVEAQRVARNAKQDPSRVAVAVYARRTDERGGRLGQMGLMPGGE